MNRGEINAHHWVKENCLKPGDRFTRVENVAWSGMFDTNACFGGVECWIENKAPTEPARATTRLFSGNHPFSQDQKNFALAQLRAGGNCWGFINTNLRQILISGWWIEEANDLTVDQLLAVSEWSRIKQSRTLKLDAIALRAILAQPTPGKSWNKTWNNRTKAATAPSLTSTNWNA